MSTSIPASWVRNGHGIPTVCSRHGEPATTRGGVSIESPPPGWTLALIPLGLLAYFIARSATRKYVAAKAWPFCPRCRTLRRNRFATLGLVAVAGACMIAAAAAGLPDPVPALLAFSGLTLLLTGYIGAFRARWAVIGQARVTQDGMWVQVRRAAPEFDAQVTAVLEASRRPVEAIVPTAQPVPVPAADGWRLPA